MKRRPGGQKNRRSGPVAKGASKTDVTINLVPMLDAMVTIIAFLMFTMTFLAVVSIESPIPITNQEILNRSLKRPPLQLSLSVQPGQLEVWSPFDRIRSRIIRNLPDGSLDLVRLHDVLVRIKSRFPRENQLILVPDPGTSYDILIAVMDAARFLEDGDEPIYIKDPASGIDIETKGLFPEIVFGNLLGES